MYQHYSFVAKPITVAKPVADSVTSTVAGGALSVHEQRETVLALRQSGMQGRFKERCMQNANPRVLCDG